MSVFKDIIKGMADGAEALQANFAKLAKAISAIDDDGTIHFGSVSADDLAVSGDGYKTPASATANYLGLTISFIRIGKQVTFTSGVTGFNTAVVVGLTNNVLPDGFKPALQQNVSATSQDGGNKYFSFDPAGSIYSYSAYSSGTQPRISGSYITNDAWPD
ncbi:hypothetical protein HAU30_09290 [Weissella confusa]|uniref:hypothetical protein n=1 Tax=Weissella confusa TaxID=1583 RepID=UPI0018F2410F|nr:hypothetical protein [Weissella confusa]MBJ7680653.1 hypothetical protein [Weissella confusa]